MTEKCPIGGDGFHWPAQWRLDHAKNAAAQTPRHVVEAHQVWVSDRAGSPDETNPNEPKRTHSKPTQNRIGESETRKCAIGGARAGDETNPTVVRIPLGMLTGSSD
jgi:hypothetical protein